MGGDDGPPHGGPTNRGPPAPFTVMSSDILVGVMGEMYGYDVVH